MGWACFHFEGKVEQMEHPNRNQHNAADQDITHHKESDAHKKGYGTHDAGLGCFGKAVSTDKTFHVFTIEFGVFKPCIKAFAAS